jgi:N12 class adenine-specific DNA methylase
MARKYDLISEMYRRTAHAVISDVQNWQAFLRCACRNYRLRFDEKLLIYAQRPDATAVLEIERWNDKFGRWVNRGAKGIAVFEDAERSRQRLIHYFDISDTHESRYSRPVPIWDMKPEYTDDVIESLENTFGDLENKDSLADAVMSAAKNAVEDNIPDYLSDLMYAADDSFLYGLSEDMITSMYKKAVTNSVAYMMMTRLGIDTEPFFESEDFSVITNFNTPEALNALGIAASDIAEMGLGEISRTILALDRQNRIIADRGQSDYNKAENTSERSFENERADIHNAGRLQSSRPDNAQPAGSDSGQVRSDETEVSQGTPQNPVLQSSDELHPDRAFGGGRTDGDETGRNPDEADGSAGGLDREPESGGYDEVGTGNEQLEKQSTGDRESGSNLRLDYYDRRHEDTSLPFFGRDDTIREILGITPHLKASKAEIRAFYESNPDNAARTEYVKGIFNNDYTEVILSDGRRVGYKTWQNVLQLWEGSYLSRTKQSFYDWGVIAQHFEAMRLLGELQDTMKPLPSIDGQLNFMETQAEEKTSAFSFSQEIIDAVLTRGSGVSEGKFRIFEQFEKSLSAKENVDFLKDEYGWGGAYPVITGTGIDEQHDGKGILISKGIGDDKPHIRLNWNQVEKRIKELIRLDRYLNPKEKEIYPQWLEKQEERRAELAEEQRNREILSSAPPQQETVQTAASEPEQEAQYAYHLGDTVYMGADEYEILSFNDERVVLHDVQFPLFQKEMDRAEFDRKVRENPMNDHLKVKELPPEEKTDEAPAFDIGMGYLGNGLTVWNRAVEESGDYQTIAHISDEGEIHYYVDGLPEDVVARIEQAAAQEQQKSLFAASYQVGDRVYLNGKPFEITRVDDWNVELMDRSEQNPQPRLESKDNFMQLVQQNERNTRFTDNYREYSGIKEENPDSLVLYQVGDFFEAYGADAQTVSEALELNLTSRFIGNNQQTEMCGFPANRLETYINMLLDRGFDVAVSATENGERNTRNIVSSNKEDPVQSQPVGRIDYLHTDGTVRESIEYTSPYHFASDIREETYYGVPFKVDFYKDKEGNTISREFAEHLDPPPQGIAIIDSPYLEKDKTENALPPDERFFVIETDEGYAIWDDLTEAIYIDDEGVSEEFKSEWQANDYLEQVKKSVSEKEATGQPEPEQKEAAPLTPAFVQPKRSRVQTFDLHPEIPLSERHTFDLASHEVPEAGKKERFRRNMEAIRVLKECEFENRFATPEEQEILSQYVGWGGIPEAFDENNSSWADEFIELYTALSPDEYESARASTLTAFYTPPAVISSIYKAMEQMGFREGNILEPSCGIGNFIGMLPQSMQDSKIYGVEIDKISAGIAQQLYQKTSIAAQPFEEANIPDSFFDAVIGNVPFGDIRVNDRRYNKHNFLIHDYFFAKSLDKLRPGGVMALITSKGTMDKESPAVRKYIAQRADLLGAIRLPNNTFKGNAGTEVVSDILILQKRDRLIDLEPDWVHLNTDENGVKMNAYFVDHPEMVLGEWKTVSGRFGQEDTVVPYENADLAELLEEAISNIHAEITDYEVDEELTEEDNSIPADPEVRNFSYTVVDDKIYYRENSRMAPVDVSATAENRIKGMIAIRDCVRNLIEMQTADYSDYEVEKEQQKLNKLYDTFSKKYGLINSRANVSAFSQDSSFALLSALEVLDENGELERKADMFTKRTIKPHTPVTSVDTASEALAISMGEKAQVDMEYMCSLTGKTEQEIYQELKGVIFLNPMYGYGNSDEQKYLMADEYLSGNVRQKLAWARKSAEVYPEDYKINVEALEKVQPKDLTASEIFVQLGTTWLPEEIAQQFMYEFLDTPVYARWNIKVHYSKLTGEWNVEGKSYDRGNLKAYNTYGTKRVNAYKIIEETLNMKDVRVFDYIEDADGKKKAVLNKKETAIAQSKQELIKQGFQDWVWRDPERREKLVRLYNEKFNSIRPREYDGSHIVFSGINPEITLREHQKNAVAHILYGGNTLLAHAVGAGKTYEMTAAAMESKRLGLCNKSLFVVPNHLTEQWAAEFLQLYPAANILVATKKDFEMKKRKRFCGRIATGDYDAVIIGHSQFEKIPISIERQRAVLQQQLDDIIEGIADIKRNRGDRFSVKQLEKTKRSLQTKLQKLNDQSRKDDVVTFEELGVDRLFIDESHYYKNLYLYTKMRNVGGIAQTEAQKSSDLFMKCRYLDEITGGRGVVFATGTPISNSMVELYTIQRYLQYRILQEHDLQHFDAWASSFGEMVTAVELTPEGTGYRAKTRFAKFNNLPELMAMFKQVADIKTADMLNLPVPEVEYHNIAVKPSQVQKEMVASLGERAERIRGGGVDSSVDNMLKVTNDGRKLALDQRMMNPMLPDEESSKVNACVNEVFRIWEESSDKKLTQLLFCDLSTPKGEGEFSVYTDIRKKLIERGIPEAEIKFIHEADTEAKKQELFKKVRRGEVRILMGSTQKMGAGTNVQNKIIASHDLDCPWRPADLEQRAGRTVRQGNENPKVGLYRYVTEGTFDAYCWQLVEGKQKFASQIMTSKSPVRSCEDVDATALSYAEIKMLAADNPHIKEKMDLDIQVQKLRLLKSNYLSEKYELEDKIIKYYPKTIAQTKETIAGLEKDISLAKEHPKSLDDTFVGIEVKGVFYPEKAEGGQRIIDACKEMTSPDPIPLGKYRGFDLELSFEPFEKAYQVKIKGNLSRSISLGADAIGNITRIDNAIEKLPERLEAKKQELSTLEQQFATAKAEVEKPFDKEEELTEKTNRLNVLNGLLNVDKRENELVDGAPDEGDSIPGSKEKAYER